MPFICFTHALLMLYLILIALLTHTPLQQLWRISLTAALKLERSCLLLANLIYYILQANLIYCISTS
jgi:hypothetical protein